MCVVWLCEMVCGSGHQWVCLSRPRQPRDSAQPGFLLPSPSLSLLGARRTLSVLCAGEAARPVRRTRGRGEGERARDRVHSHRPAEAPSAEDLSYTRWAVCRDGVRCVVRDELCAM